MKIMNKGVLTTIAVALFAILPSAGQAQAGTDMSKFSLARGIPSDVFIAVSARANHERQFLDSYWGDVKKAFFDSGILTDVWDLMTDSVSDDQIDEIEDIADRFTKLFEKVEWSGLFEKEFVHAGRFRTGPDYMMYEGLIMGRSDAKKVQSNYGELKALLEELVKFVVSKGAPADLAVAESRKEGARIASLQFGDSPFSISIAAQGDVMIINWGGSSILDEALALLKGSSKKKGLIQTSRFKKAFSQLPPAEDELVFFDAERMLGTIRNLLAGLSKSMPHDSPEGNKEKNGEASTDASNDAWILKLVSTLLNDISIVDYMATVEWTDGYQVFSDSVTVTRDGATKSPLYQILTRNAPLKHFEKFIPKEAKSFSVSSGLNLAGLYDYLTTFIKKQVPGGEDKIEQFSAFTKDHWEIDIKKDILELFNGPVVQASVGRGWVILAKVTDEKKTEGQIEHLLTSVNDSLGQQNALMVSPVKINKKIEFKQISHPMMMMVGGMSPPVLGCADGYFIAGSSAKMVRRCLKTAHGHHPNITHNRRWKAEGLLPNGKISSISFTDESQMAQELQAGLSGASLAMGMLGMFAADAPPEFQKFMTSFPPILAKLGPVLGKLSFYKSNASYSSFDGHQWTSHHVQNYKKPEENKADDVQEARVP